MHLDLSWHSRDMDDKKIGAQSAHVATVILAGCTVCGVKAWLNEDESEWESQLSLSFDLQLSCTLMHSHQLWAGSNFDESQWEVWLVWPVMRVARESQRVAKASDFQVITHNKKKKKRKHYYVSSTSDSWSNDSDCQQFDKRQKTKRKNRGSNEQKLGNRKKKKDSRQLSCNFHCSFDRAVRVEETLMQTLACQLSSTLILVWSRLNTWTNIVQWNKPKQRNL